MKNEHIHVLGLIGQLNFLRLRDGRVAMSGRRVVCVELPIRRTHHLINKKITMLRARANNI